MWGSQALAYAAMSQHPPGECLLESVGASSPWITYHWLLKMTAHTHLVTTFAAAVRVIVGRTKTKTRKTFRASFSNLSVGRSCQSYSEIWVASLKHALWLKIPWNPDTGELWKLFLQNSGLTRREKENWKRTGTAGIRDRSNGVTDQPVCSKCVCVCVCIFMCVCVCVCVFWVFSKFFHFTF